MKYRGQLFVVCATGCAATFIGASGSAGALAPAVAAWWSVTNVGAVAAPPPPDVKSDDLFVQGSNAAQPGTVPGLGGGSSVQAFAALWFPLPLGAVVGPLRLQLDPASTALPAVSLVACRVTRSFRAARNGPFAEAPGYDPVNCVPATRSADGASLVFAQVRTLVRDTTLAVALVPGPLDRVVLLPPSSAALTVSLAAEPGPAGLPRLPENHPSPAGVATSPSWTPVAEALPTMGSTPVNNLISPQPVLAPVLAPLTALSTAPVSTGRVTDGLARPVAVTQSVPGASQGRLLASLGVLGLLAFSVVGATRNLADGRRANVPDRGVGRYRATRNGKAPRLS